ncbi:GPW/gp25 family protein [Poseidonocella sp. HB161398]|uniref:GPW/gp25 family protein n=1 Tax=Poseidonocella sp. HB161398 TaxID=2320855 RepID=UPI0011083A6B|nr:GPW/gp25 family protein [Poseidonocella sp. HB161398]
MTASPFLPREPIGWPLLPVPDETGSLRWPGLDLSVRQTIRAILMTRRGELLLARDRGVGLADYLHRPNSADTRRELRERIIAAIGAMEPRVRLDAVDLAPAGDRGEELTITITYSIRRTGSPGAVSVTMKLGG